MEEEVYMSYKVNKRETLTGILSCSCWSASFLLVREVISRALRRVSNPATLLTCFRGLRGVESNTTSRSTS